MSDENSSGSASSAEQMVPKSRLDELIAQKNAAQQQAQFFQQTLGSLINQQRAARPPDAEDVEMERLKEDNPVAYRLHLKQKQTQQDLKQVRAGFSSLADELDRNKFLSVAGKEGAKYQDRVEQILQAERQQGRFGADRQGIYVFLKGQEQLQKDRQAAAPAQAAQAQVSDGDAPTSDPQFASTLRTGAATTVQVGKSREELAKELENVEF